MIVEKLDSLMESKRRVFPCRSNRASELGHVCERYLVYCRTRWAEKQLPELGLQYVFDYGNTIEEMTLRRLREAGVVVDNQQRDYEDRKLGITGHVDGLLEDGSPLEIKSMNQFIFQSVKTVEDLMQSDRAWLRKYPAQIQLYCYLASKPRGCLLLIDKQTSQAKELWIDLDYAYCEALLQKAERINQHVTAETYPERIQYDPDLCDGCSFVHLCLPPVSQREQLYLTQAPDIAAKCERREGASLAATEYKRLDTEIKDWAKRITQQANISCGDWLITKKARKDGAVTVEIKRVAPIFEKTLVQRKGA